MSEETKSPSGNTLPVVTIGDVVLDRHIYQGDRIFPNQPGKVDPHYREDIGGAFLLHRIILEAVGDDQARFGLNPLPISCRSWPCTRCGQRAKAD